MGSLSKQRVAIVGDERKQTRLTVKVQVLCLWKTKCHRGSSSSASSLLWCLMQPCEEAWPPHQAYGAVMGTKQELPSFHEKSLWNHFLMPFLSAATAASAPNANLGSLASVTIFPLGMKMLAIILIWGRCVYLKWPVAFGYSPRTVISRTSFT